MSDITFRQDDFRVVGKDLAGSERIVRKSLTYWQDAWMRLKANRMALVGLIIIIIITLMCFLVPSLSENTFNFQDYDAINQGPSSEHLFGTDELGRDLWVRSWKGGQISLLIAVASTIINVTIGVIYGGISGHFGGKVDIVMMRFYRDHLFGAAADLVDFIALCHGQWARRHHICHLDHRMGRHGPYRPRPGAPAQTDGFRHRGPYSGGQQHRVSCGGT